MIDGIGQQLNQNQSAGYDGIDKYVIFIALQCYLNLPGAFQIAAENKVDQALEVILQVST